MPAPKDTTEWQRAFELVNYMDKFIPVLSAKTKAICLLLEITKEWTWIQDTHTYKRMGIA